MIKNPKIEYASIDDLNLDPTNPRLGRSVASPKLTQEDALDAMRDWSLEELAESFLSNGFWPQEAVIVIEEKLYGKLSLVVVEGNRRIAALKYLQLTANGKPPKSNWLNLIKGIAVEKSLFDSVPYIRVDKRSDVSAYLGFRHVTGIKEWRPAEKAQYIARLIEQEGLSYDDVRRKIGSKANTVRQHYIAYKLLLQMENEDGVSIEKVEDKFSVLYLSLRTSGVQKYLHIDIQASESKANSPVPEKHLSNLVSFSRWLFGDENVPPLFNDSRNVDNFGKVLESDEAVEYLERTPNPRFELAVRKAGVGEQEIISLVSSASDNIQLVLTDAHIYKQSAVLHRSVQRLGKDFAALLNVLPSIKGNIVKEIVDACNS